MKALRYPTRPLSSDLQGEEPGKFPFDAFEVDESSGVDLLYARTQWILKPSAIFDGSPNPTQIYISDDAPTTNVGLNGDIWFEY